VADERKATDVLLEIESKVNETIAIVRNTDLKIAIILDKLNKQLLIKQPNDTSNISFPTYQPTTTSPFDAAPDLKAKLQFALEEAQRDEQLASKPTVDTHQEGKRRNLRFHGDVQSRQIPVQQRILYADGKNVYMANVDILDIENKLVKQTKTNQVGKWLASLSPGDYQVNVFKAGTQLKPKVELSYRVTIPNQDSTVELETRKVQ